MLQTTSIKRLELKSNQWEADYNNGKFAMMPWSLDRDNQIRKQKVWIVENTIVGNLYAHFNVMTSFTKTEIKFEVKFIKISDR